MNNKTCGECKYFNRDYSACGANKHVLVSRCEYREACDIFDEKPKPTVGDKIRQMNNTDLAEMLVYPVKPVNINGNMYYEFTSCLLIGKSYPMHEQAVFLTERRLNAPAESEGNNGEK